MPALENALEMEQWLLQVENEDHPAPAQPVQEEENIYAPPPPGHIRATILLKLLAALYIILENYYSDFPVNKFNKHPATKSEVPKEKPSNCPDQIAAPFLAQSDIVEVIHNGRVNYSRETYKRHCQNVSAEEANYHDHWLRKKFGDDVVYDVAPIWAANATHARQIATTMLLNKQIQFERGICKTEYLSHSKTGRITCFYPYSTIESYNENDVCHPHVKRESYAIYPTTSHSVNFKLNTDKGKCTNSIIAPSMSPLRIAEVIKEGEPQVTRDSDAGYVKFCLKKPAQIFSEHAYWFSKTYDQVKIYVGTFWSANVTHARQLAETALSNKQLDITNGKCTTTTSGLMCAFSKNAPQESHAKLIVGDPCVHRVMRYDTTQKTKSLLNNPFRFYKNKELDLLLKSEFATQSNTAKELSRKRAHT